MALWLRAVTALSEDWIYNPAPHTEWFTNVSSSKESNPTFRGTVSTWIHAYTQNKNFVKKPDINVSEPIKVYD